MQPESNKTNIDAKWGPRCLLTLMISVGLAMGYLVVRAPDTHGGGWFAKLVAGSFLFILGFLGTLMCVDFFFRLISLAMYLRIYGFSSKGLKDTSQSDEADSSKKSLQ